MQTFDPADPVAAEHAVPHPTPDTAPAAAPFVRKEVGPAVAIPSARPAALSATPNLLALLLALRRRWRLGLGLGLICAAAAALAVWHLRPITYSGRTKLHVASVVPKVLFETSEGRADFSNYQRAQVALVRSRLVLNSALRDPKVAALAVVQSQPDPVDWLERTVQADFSTAPEVLRIVIPGDNPEELKILIPAVRDAYMREIVDKEKGVKIARLDRLKKLHAEYDGILKGKKDTLKRMAKSLGSGDRKLLVTQQELTLKHINELHSELLRKQSELRTADLELTVSKAREKSGAKLVIPESVIEKQVYEDILVLRYRKEITEREQEIALFKGRAPKPEREPGYQRAVNSLAVTKKLLAERCEQLRPILIAQATEKVRAEGMTARYQQQEKVEFLREMERVLKGQVDSRQKEVGILKNGTVDLEWLQDEIAEVDRVSKEVSRQKQVLEVEIEAPPRVTELEEAVVTPSQTASGRLRFAGGAGFGAFGAILVGVAFLEFRARRVSSVEEVTHGLKMKLVGSLPVVPRRALSRSGGPKAVHWQNRLTESIDAIRTALLNAARLEGLRVVMVTSAAGGEGKTLLSCHLAASLARAGCKTLLIDGDLRRPSIHRLFGLSSERGLGEILRLQAEVGAAIQPGLVDGLSVMTAGQSGSKAVHALARRGVGDLLQLLREEYDFIVVDSAPVLPVADSQAIAQHVDAVVFSVMRGVSRLPEVYAAWECLTALRVKVLGAVVSGNGGGSAYGGYHTYDYSAPAEPGPKA